MSAANDIVHTLLSVALQSAADVVQERVSRPINLVSVGPPDENAFLRFDVQFGDGLNIAWYISNSDATGFSDLLIGGSGDRDAVLTEMHLDGLSNAFSGMIERTIETLNTSVKWPLTSTGVDMSMEGEIPRAGSGKEHTVGFELDGLGLVTIVQHANAALIDYLAANVKAGVTEADVDAAAHAVAVEHHKDDNVVSLPHVSNDSAAREPGDIRMLLNVPLQVTVELGRTEQSVRELLELNVGSIIELSKLAGDPMDIMVNGKVLARGEVVVIDEEFGIRVTEILSPEDRLRRLG